MQFDFAGALPLAEGRYLARSASPDPRESVLVLQQIGAPRAAGRRRRSRGVEAGPEPVPLALTRATAIRAFAQFADAGAAARWLDEACETEAAAEALVAEGLALLNRALYVLAVATASPKSQVELDSGSADRVLLGFGSGEELADGRFTEARQIDARPRASRRSRREEELRPQERLAAVLSGREQLGACEPLLLRARADLDAGRTREAALQLRIGLEALLVELKGVLSDPGHGEDMSTLAARKSEVGAAANAALEGELAAEQRQQVEDLLRISERVLRRRRVLRG